eukprot:CAMPEP_0196583922 /NCGR_PEP_ID=MMETSP1081-20130531/45227_1 /TAXON_ID=36882 /ORGANISM="Pyramimonas amylifera, Strain CCMP720" /LENGTH=130 /DNA_ID=CAMNT_0041904961 /DNA_START=247 /DNA_END=639 /DNA_ORIENTATION=-
MIDEQALHFEALDQFASLFPDTEVFTFIDVSSYQEHCLLDPTFCGDVIIQCDFHVERLDSVLNDVLRNQGLVFRLLNLCCGEAPLPNGPDALEQMDFATYADIRQLQYMSDSDGSSLIVLGVEVTKPSNF